MCRVPKERYAVLGHRALSVLAAGKEGEEEGMGGMASLLTQQLSEEGQQVSCKVKETLGKDGNLRVETSWGDDHYVPGRVVMPLRCPHDCAHLQMPG